MADVSVTRAGGPVKAVPRGSHNAFWLNQYKSKSAGQCTNKPQNKFLKIEMYTQALIWKENSSWSKH